jgi:diguanylate cyclase (GGDEF)-like protein/PAS domain S-box-containing protein
MISANALYEVRRILRSFPVAACLVDREPRYIAANQKYADIFNDDLDSIVGKPMANFSHGKGIENTLRDFRTFDSGESVPDHELELYDKHYLVSVGPIASEQSGEIIAISCALTEITKLKHMEHRLEETNSRLSSALQKITEIAETDQLTGLYNRHAFEKYAMSEIARIKRTKIPLSAILIDVDFFKAYNDMYGHIQGDDCLQAVAKAIRRGARRSVDFPARYGGEEFIILLPNTELAGAIDTAHQIREALAEFAIKHDGSPHQYLSVSMGVFCLPDAPPLMDMKGVRELILNGADHALYQAKERGRNTIHVAEITDSLYA